MEKKNEVDDKKDVKQEDVITLYEPGDENWINL